MANVIKFKRGTTANVAKLNGVDLPLLQEGEIAIDITTKTIKVGDGLTAWNNLRGINADTLDGFHASQNADANNVAVRNADGKLVGDILGNSETSTKLKTSRTLSLSGDATGSASFDGSANATIATTVNNAAQAAKLTTARIIALSGDASGSTTFDGSANVTISATVNDSAKVGGYSPSETVEASTVPVRDANGALPGNITGNAATATKLATARTIALSGDARGSVTFDGTADKTISTTVSQAAKLKTPRTITLSGDVSGSTSFDGSTNVTISSTVNDSAKVGGYSPATTATANAVAVRDENGKLAGDILGNAATATLAADATKLATARTISLGGNASGSANFDGSANVTILATVNDSAKVGGYSPSTTATANAVAIRDANGKLAGDITGNAATATLATSADKLTTARTITLSGGVTGSTNFDGSTNTTIVTNVTGDSHYHTISTITDIANASVSQANNATKLNNYSPSTSATPSTVAVRDTNGKLAGDITGNADTVDGFHASQSATANSIAVRDASGKLAGDITGNAATATNASKLAGLLPSTINKPNTVVVRDSDGNIVGGTIVGQIDSADKVDGFHASQSAIPNNVAVRDANGKLPGNVLGHAEATYEELIELSEDVDDVIGFAGYEGSGILGLEWDVPSGTVRRLGAAVGKNGGADFDQYNMYGGRKRCILTDDGVRLAYYGEPGFTETGKLEEELTIGGVTYPVGTPVQVMVEQPVFWYKTVPLKFKKIPGQDGLTVQKIRYYISDTARPGFKRHPAFYTRTPDRKPVNYIYLGAYEGCTYDSSTGEYLLNDESGIDFNNDKLSSIANAIPTSTANNFFRFTSAQQLVKNRGNGWQLNDIFSLSAIQILFAIEYGSFDSQAMLGNGVNGRISTGSTSTFGNVSGVSQNNAITYRGQENLWGNTEELIDGVNIYATGTKVKAYISYYDFEAAKDAKPYFDVGFDLATGNNYISAIGWSEICDFTFLPTENEGLASKPLHDVYFSAVQAQGFKAFLFGGGISAARTGLFYTNCSSGYLTSASALAARIIYVPTNDPTKLSISDKTIHLIGDVTGSTALDETTNVFITTTVNNSAKLDGKSPSTSATANTVPVRDSTGKLAGDITGNSATATKLVTARTISLTGDATGSTSFDGSANASITATVSQAAKLKTPRTISLSGDVSGSTSFDGSANATIATTVNNAAKLNNYSPSTTPTANSIPVRDANGRLVGDITGNAATATSASSADTATTATKLATARTLALSGDVTGSASFDGSANATISATVNNAAQAAKLATARTITLTGDASGSSSFDGTSNVSIAATVNNAAKVGGYSPATTATASTVAVRDANGKLAGDILGNAATATSATSATTATKLATARTIALTGDVTGSTTFDGSANKTITTTVNNSAKVGGYSPSTSATANAVAVRDTNGKLPGDITGNAATATKADKLTTSRIIRLTGDVSGSTPFDGSRDATIAVTVDNSARLAGYSPNTSTGANTIPVRNSSGALPGNILGNAATATKLATARTIALTGDVTGSASFDGSANATINTTSTIAGFPKSSTKLNVVTGTPSGNLEANKIYFLETGTLSSGTYYLEKYMPVNLNYRIFGTLNSGGGNTSLRWLALTDDLIAYSHGGGSNCVFEIDIVGGIAIGIWLFTSETKMANYSSGILTVPTSASDLRLRFIGSLSGSNSGLRMTITTWAR